MIDIRDITPAALEHIYVTEELVRELRDYYLSETDWTANSDVTMSAAMATYRQALRDVPSQAGFPANVTWPTKPSGA